MSAHDHDHGQGDVGPGRDPGADRWADGWEILEKAGELSRAGEEFALATVVWRQGPSSGQQGSRAIITADGGLHGWIGGACAEPVVIREAQRVIREREARLLLLGTPEQFGGGVPDGMTVIPIACQSEGALEVYVEPVVSTLHLVVVGRSPMAHTLAELSRTLGWRSEVHDPDDFASVELDARSIVVIATQGNGDEEAIERAASAEPAFIGLVASRKRAEAVLGYLAERGVPRHQLDRVHAPVGLDLGHTTHREIAVAILAELVAFRAAGNLSPSPGATATTSPAPESAIDPVCQMTVDVTSSRYPLDLDGVTYHFCCAGCRDRFQADPAAYLTADHTVREA